MRWTNSLCRILLTLSSSVIGNAALHANVVGSDLQNFNATTGGIDFVTVQSSETIEPGLFNLGVMTNYAVNSLPYYSDEMTTQNRLNPNDSLLTSEFLVSAGLWKNIEIGASLSRLMRQRIEDKSQPHGRLNDGWTNYRLNLKARIAELNGVGIAAIYTMNINRIANNPYMGAGQDKIHIIELALSKTIQSVDTALNLGYRYRKKGDAIPGEVIKPTGDQLTASVAASYLLPVVDTKIIFEIFGARPTGAGDDANMRRQSSSLEGLVGVKHDATDNLALHGGMGTELIHGASSPDWRLYAGLNYAVGTPRKSDLPVVRGAKESVVTLHSLQFDFAADALAPQSLEQINKLADLIRSSSYKEIIVQGHTDSVGSEAFNQKLSERRAAAVRKAMLEILKMDPTKIRSEGFGESRPIADNGNYQGRQRNRRVEVRIVH